MVAIKTIWNWESAFVGCGPTYTATLTVAFTHNEAWEKKKSTVGKTGFRFSLLLCGQPSRWNISNGGSGGVGTETTAW